MRSRSLIAVVDDEESVRKALGRLMRAAGLDVEPFACGNAFLDSLSEHRPDCVLLDLHMPGMDGFEVMARLARLKAGVPVVVITGHDAPGALERALATGAREYLRKPIDERVLLDAIAAATAAA